MTSYRIDPLDRLFFRQNTAFDMDMSSNVKTIFPPYPSTIVGMARTLMAVAAGWDGNEWGQKQKDLVGSADDLNGMKFRGPYLHLNANVNIMDERGENSDEPISVNSILFPVPRNLIKHADGSYEILQPVGKYRTNLNNNTPMQLPAPADHKAQYKVASGYITIGDMKKLLEGETNVTVIPSPWSTEIQVGNHLDPKTKSTKKENSLFSREMVRPNEGLTLLYEVENEAKELDKQFIGYLGGETRMVNVQKTEDITFPEIRPDDYTRFTITLITPGLLGNNTSEVIDTLEKTFGTSPITACVPNPVRIGGWDYAKRQPKTLRPYLIPGTVFYFDTSLDRVEVNPRGIYHIGDRTDFGFGQYLIGKW